MKHKWSKAVYGYWICPCGEYAEVKSNPAPPYGECTYPWPQVDPADSHPQYIEALSNLHFGQTMYVLASGATLNYIDPMFFYNKPTIAINEVHRDFPCTYLLAHHGECCQDAIDKGLAVVTSEYLNGVTAWGNNVFRGSYYVYKHLESPHFTGVDMSVVGKPDYLIISSCTAAEAIHLAVHMGAKSVVLCGLDGGSIDGKVNYDGYNDGHGTLPDHLNLTLPILINVVHYFRKEGINIYSLNPFMDLGLEGHRFER